VVITRNEERHIGQSLDALKRALQRFPHVQVVLVDSGSADRTVEIASRHAVEIYRYAGSTFSAAAGRRLGLERTQAPYVLFLDGDCCIEPGWIELGLEALERDERIGVVYGRRLEVFEAGTERAGFAAPTPEEYGLGGNAMYRAAAIREVGSFNPYIPAGEEGELLGRLLVAGYKELAIPNLMFTHYTLAKTSTRGFISRLHRGLAHGLGRTLRESVRQGTFLYHARRLNRYLVMLAYLVAGIATAAASLGARSILPIVAWTAFGVLAFLLLCARRRSVRSALFIAMDWLVAAVHLPIDFFRSTPCPEHFSPPIERLR
jgi:glycosyltransferase involved in cell wall biosynthesis